MLPGREDPHKLRGSMKTLVGTFSWRPGGFSWRPACRLFLGSRAADLQAFSWRPGRLGTLYPPNSVKRINSVDSTL